MAADPAVILDLPKPPVLRARRRAGSAPGQAAGAFRKLAHRKGSMCWHKVDTSDGVVIPRGHTQNRTTVPKDCRG
jgi:hypothetical protein